MVWALVQVNCGPHAVDKYPMAKTLVVLAWFASEEEAREHWPRDLVHTPDNVLEGQVVYQLLWNVSTPLNIDRSVDNCNKISTVGSWLPESLRQPIDHADKIELVFKGAANAASAKQTPQTMAAARAAAKIKAKPQPLIPRKGRSGPFSSGRTSASAVGRLGAGGPDALPRKPAVSAAQVRANQVQAAIAAASVGIGPDVKLVPIMVGNTQGGYRPPQVWRPGEGTR